MGEEFEAEVLKQCALGLGDEEAELLEQLTHKPSATPDVLPPPPVARRPRSSMDYLHSSFRDWDRSSVWGTTSTPAMQTLECISQIKNALQVKGTMEEDAINRSSFTLIATTVVGLMAFILLLWEFRWKPAQVL